MVKASYYGPRDPGFKPLLRNFFLFLVLDLFDSRKVLDHGIVAIGTWEYIMAYGGCENPFIGSCVTACLSNHSTICHHPFFCRMSIGPLPSCYSPFYFISRGVKSTGIVDRLTRIIFLRTTETTPLNFMASATYHKNPGVSVSCKLK